MKKIGLQYDPNLSIEENAEKCGVTVHAIRWYIKTHDIDRRFDAQMAKFLAVQKVKAKNPNASVKEIAEKAGLAQNTVRKYLKEENAPSKVDSSKLSKFDLSKATSVIKSVSKSQDEILYNILRLYVKTETFDCDLTTSIGVFYHGIIPFPKHLYDKYPQMDNVRSLDEAYNLPDNIFHSIVVDLPFIVKDKQSARTSMISKRFSSFLTIKELYDANDTMLELSYRLLKSKGFLIMKTMDVNYSLKQYWLCNYVQNKAKELGFRLRDIFILVSKTKILSAEWKQQHSARKYHSYFLVFEK